MVENRKFFLSEATLSVNFQDYRRCGVNPPLEFSEVSAQFLSGDQRQHIGMHVAGDVSLVLSYKETPAFVMSYQLKENGLWIIHMQGNKKKNKGYRVNSGMNVPAFFADQTCHLLFHPENTFFDTVLLPQTISGISEDHKVQEDRRPGIEKKYLELRERLRMELDPTLQAYVTSRERLRVNTNK